VIPRALAALDLLAAARGITGAQVRRLLEAAPRGRGVVAARVLLRAWEDGRATGATITPDGCR
jgi:hypothetical protein